MLDSARTRGFTGGGASGKPEFVVGGRQQGTSSLPTSTGSSRWRRTTACVLGFGAALAITFCDDRTNRSNHGRWRRAVTPFRSGPTLMPLPNV